jgi:NADH-quinone oxidoreductase subunit J
VEVSNRSVGRLPAIVIVAGTFAVLYKAYAAAPWHAAETVGIENSTFGIGNALLGEYILPFELASVVLLAVLVGAVVLSRKEVAEGASSRPR